MHALEHRNRHVAVVRFVAGLPLLAVLLGGCLLAPGASAQTAPSVAGTAQANVPATSAVAVPRYLPNRFAGRAGAYYRVYWGIDHLSVKEAESGQIVRFSWRVLDPGRAALLNDKKLEPALISPQAGVSLVVPTLDQIGQMRQTTPPEAGHAYWMAFSNKGHHIRRGDRVDVVVGTFRAEGLVVD